MWHELVFWTRKPGTGHLYMSVTSYTYSNSSVVFHWTASLKHVYVHLNTLTAFAVLTGMSTQTTQCPVISGIRSFSIFESAKLKRLQSPIPIHTGLRKEACVNFHRSSHFTSALWKSIRGVSVRREHTCKEHGKTLRRWLHVKAL